ncbi:class I adenylate-forming enzyme family protein [Persicimonas caeni]|nr:AMP-binding protein [Persicimonas caeni]
MEKSRTNAGKDTLLRAGKRLLKVGLDSRLVRDVVSAPRGAPDVLAEIVRHGLSVKNVHAIHAAQHPERLAMVDEHRQVTYAQANDEINRVGNALRNSFGVKRGTPVVLMMENRVEYLTCWFSLFRIGASGVHASYRMTAEELGYQVDHSGARILFVSPTSLEAARELDRTRDDLDLTIILVGDETPPDGVLGYAHVIDQASSEFATPSGRRVSKDESQNIVYTSGTTGQPKGTVRNFTKYGLLEFTRLLDRLPLQAGDRHLVVAPVYHSGGQVFTLLNSALAATLVLRPHFDAQDTLEHLSSEQINTVFMVPTMIRRVLDLPDDVHRQNPTPTLRGLISGAAPFPRVLRERAIERFGASTVHDFYGATELGWVTLINGEEMRERPGSVGRPLAGQEVRILDDDMNEVPRGEVGKIWVRNQHAVSGYLHDRKASDEIRAGDWVTVEDLGYIDEDDYVYLAGRARDMVISGGVNIYPVEVENVLAQHPSVDDVAVIGVPDEEWGETLVAVVVPANDTLDTDVLEAHAREHLTGYKVPRRWVTTDAIPRNPTGKILKNELERRYS